MMCVSERTTKELLITLQTVTCMYQLSIGRGDSCKGLGTQVGVGDVGKAFEKRRVRVHRKPDDFAWEQHGDAIQKDAERRRVSYIVLTEVCCGVERISMNGRSLVNCSRQAAAKK